MLIIRRLQQTDASSVPAAKPKKGSHSQHQAMSAVEDRLPAVTDDAAASSNDAACAEALAALEAELAAQDEQFQLLASTMKLTAESLDEL